MTHEGRVLRADGSPEKGNWTLTFALYTQASGGAPVWTEQKTITLSENGYYSTLLGESPALPALIAPAYWLGVAVQGESEMTPRTRLASVGYALRSAEADHAARFSVEQKSAALGSASTGQYLRLAQVGVAYEAAIQVDWAGALHSGACCGQGTLVFRVGKQGSSAQASEDFFRVEAQYHQNPPVFDRVRVIRDASDQYWVEAFVPAGITPGSVSTTLREGTGATLVTPVLVAPGSPTVQFETGISSSAFAAGAGEGDSLALLQNGNLGLGTTVPSAKIDVRFPQGGWMKARNLFYGRVDSTVDLVVDQGMGLLFVSAWYFGCGYQGCYHSARTYSYTTQSANNSGGTQVQLLSNMISTFDGPVRTQVIAAGTGTSNTVRIESQGSSANVVVYQLAFF